MCTEENMECTEQNMVCTEQNIVCTEQNICCKIESCAFCPQTVDTSRTALTKTHCYFPIVYCTTSLVSLIEPECLLWGKGLTYLLTPWSRVPLENLTGSQLVKIFSIFCGTRRFITAFTSARHLSLPWASSIQSMPPYPTSWRSILILLSDLRLSPPSGLLPSGFPTTALYTTLPSPIHAKCPAHLILLDLIIRTIWWWVQIIKCGVRTELLNICYMEFCTWLVEEIVARCR